jgi:hypothetical protein
VAFGPAIREHEIALLKVSVGGYKIDGVIL